MSISDLAYNICSIEKKMKFVSKARNATNYMNMNLNIQLDITVVTESLLHVSRWRIEF